MTRPLTIPCGHQDPPATAAGCPLCAVYLHSHEHNVGWGGPGLPGGGKPPPSLAPLPCVHLGGPVGDPVGCEQCGGHGTFRQRHACAVHGECSPDGALVSKGRSWVTCVGCKVATRLGRPGGGYEPDETAVTLNMGAGGLGDSLQGLLAAAGLRAAGTRVVYRCNQKWHPFVRLFGGYDALAGHDWDHHGTRVLAGPDRQLNDGYGNELRTRAVRPRWERYAANAGAPTVALPPLRDPDAVRAAGRDLAGAVLLCPFSNWSDREWGLNSWLTLERLLGQAGYRTVVLHDEPSRGEALASEKLIGAPATRVAGAMLNAAAVVGCDSGLPHLAGLLGAPAVVLCGQTSGPAVYGCYPSVRTLAGPLDCAGCWWQGPRHSERWCKPLCPALQAVAPRGVLAEVDALALPAVAAGRAVITHERLVALRDAAASARGLPGELAELGVCRGGSAAVMAHACPDKTLHLFDTWAGLPHDGGGHRAGEFAADLGETRAFLAGRRAEFHPGVFPASAGGLENLRFAAAHLDGDLYETTRDGLAWFWPRLVPGGALVVDDVDWRDTPGVRRALDEAGLSHLATPRPGQRVLRKPS